MDLGHAVTFVAVLVAMLVGLFGLIIPVYPGLLIIWLAALVYGIFSGFGTLGIVLFILITLLLIGGEISDNLTMGAIMVRTGIPWRTVLLAIAGALVGTLFHPLIGLAAAPLITYLMEMRRLHDAKAALASLRGLFTGWGLGLLVRFSVGLVMILLWGVWVWQGGAL